MCRSVKPAQNRIPWIFSAYAAKVDYNLLFGEGSWFSYFKFLPVSTVELPSSVWRNWTGMLPLATMERKILPFYQSASLLILPQLWPHVKNFSALYISTGTFPEAIKGNHCLRFLGFLLCISGNASLQGLDPNLCLISKSQKCLEFP